MSEKIGSLKGQPIIEVTRVEAVEKPEYQSVIENCPLCDETHRHGFNEGIPVMAKRLSLLSHRAAHCRTGADAPDGYWLVYTEDTDGIDFSYGSVWPR